MKVTVVSVQAIIASRDEITWVGNVPGINRADPADRINEQLFRFFNRVEDGDHRKLEAIGYRLPSLSVGDVLHWQRMTFRVAGMGFERIEPDAVVMGLVGLSLQPAKTDGPPDASG